jgi:hypothetical protein
MKTRDMDCGHKFQETQGVKREEKDLSVNTFELGVDGGLFSQKGRDSLAKRASRTGNFCSGPLDRHLTARIRFLTRRGMRTR